MTAFIGIIGNDVPRQLVLAAGGIPIRITGSWDGPLGERASALLGTVDPVVAGILTELLAGRHSDLDGLVVCNDTQSHLRLFYVLRMLPAPALPVHLLDLPRFDSPAARRFAAHQLEDLTAFCAARSGILPTPAGLRAAAAAEAGVGSAMQRLRARRRARSPVRGAAALAAMISAGRAPSSADAVDVLDAAAGPAAPEAVRVHVTGSAHPDASVYAELEERDMVVVSDDHETGDEMLMGAVVDSDDLDEVYERLADQHFARTGGSASASIRARAELTRTRARQAGAQAVISLIRKGDDAPAWDVAALREALAADGIPVVSRQWIPRGQAGAAAADAAAQLHSERVAS